MVRSVSVRISSLGKEETPRLESTLPRFLLVAASPHSCTPYAVIHLDSRLFPFSVRSTNDDVGLHGGRRRARGVSVPSHWTMGRAGLVQLVVGGAGEVVVVMQGGGCTACEHPVATKSDGCA